MSWGAQRSRARRAVAACVAVLAAVAGPLAAARRATAAPTGPEPAAYVLVDADTGVILAAKDARRPMLVASTVKVLTALVALEHLPPDALVPVSARAAAQPAMKISMREGQVWPLGDTLRSLLMASANDAAYALAERVGGTVERFAAIAQRSAGRMGLSDTAFADPAGLDGEDAVGGGTRMSARDLAIVARAAREVPFIAETVALPSYEFVDPAGAGRRLPNHNAALLRSYPGADGLKTGYTRRAGRTLVATATRDGRTMIAVVLGTWDTLGWSTHLLDQGFATPARAQVGPRLPAVRLRLFGEADERVPAPTGRGRTDRDPGDADAAQAAQRIVTGLVAEEPGRGGGFPAWVVVAGVPVALMVAFVALRRRAVRRARARRAARARALAEARRRRMIHVVDDGLPSPGKVQPVAGRASRPRITDPGRVRAPTR
jgi:D-alanyl-D-alanine carboxypeptidase